MSWAGHLVGSVCVILYWVLTGEGLSSPGASEQSHPKASGTGGHSLQCLVGCVAVTGVLSKSMDS